MTVQERRRTGSDDELQSDERKEKHRKIDGMSVEVVEGPRAQTHKIIGEACAMQNRPNDIMIFSLSLHWNMHGIKMQWNPLPLSALHLQVLAVAVTATATVLVCLLLYHSICEPTTNDTGANSVAKRNTCDEAVTY